MAANQALIGNESIDKCNMDYAILYYYIIYIYMGYMDYTILYYYCIIALYLIVSHHIISVLFVLFLFVPLALQLQ